MKFNFWINYFLKKKFYSVEIIIFCIGLLFRLYILGYDGLWFDEVQSILRSENIINIPKTFGPPLYYFFLHFWLNFCNKNEFFLRLPSFVFGCLSLISIYIFAKYLWNQKIGIISLLILSLSPFHIWYSQETRHYALSVLICIIYLYYFLKAVNEEKISYWVIHIILFTLGIYCDYFFLLFFIPEFIIILLKKRIFYRWLICKIVSFVFYLPWLLFLIKEIKFVANSFWPPRADFKQFLITLENFTLGYTIEPVFFHISLILVILTIGLTFFHFIKNKIWDEKLYFFMLFFIIPLFVAFIIGQFWNIYFSRALIIFSIPFYLILTYCIDIILKKKIYFLPIFLFVLNLISLLNYYNRKMPAPFEYHVGVYIKKPVKPVVNYVKENINLNDIIAHTNIQTLTMFYFYGGKELAPYSYYLFSPVQDNYWKNIFLGYKGKNRERIIKIEDLCRLNFIRIWLISSSWPRDGTLDENSIAVREWMEKNYKRIFEKWFDGILVGLYEKK